MPTLVIFTTVPWNHALSVLRFRAPAELLGWRLVQGKEGVDDVYPERVEEADVVLVQRDFPRFYPAYHRVIESARRWNKPLIYDLDDLLLALPREHPNRQDYQDALGGILQVLLEADRVILSSSLLRDVLSPLRPDTSVWPTVLPDEIWRRHARRTVEYGEKIALGYIGGESHSPDLEMLSPVLIRLLGAYPSLELHFWGSAPPVEIREHPRVKYIQNEKHAYQDFAASLETVSAHIWLAPLRSSLFNRCKSAIKFWEYSALGGAGVYSRLEPYTQVVRDGENGLLASTPDEWESALRRLIENPALRMSLADGARSTLDEYGWLHHHLGDWERLYVSPIANSQKGSPLFTQMLQCYAKQVQERSESRHHEALELSSAYQALAQDHQLLEQAYQTLRQLLEAQYDYARRLEARSAQLEEILHSRSWQLLQRIHKWRHLDFSPLEPPPPPPRSPGNKDV